MAVTIKDLARETGLTAATISAYFNGANVRPYNKEKIERAIDRLGYVRNDYARGLRTHRSMTIGVLIPELSNLFSTTIVSEMEEDLRKKGYGIIVCDCRSDAAREKESVRFLMSKMADGLIVIPVSSDGSAFTELAASGTPVVAIDRITDSKNISHIVINNREASKEAVASMINEGCKYRHSLRRDGRLYGGGTLCGLCGGDGRSGTGRKDRRGSRAFQHRRRLSRD